MALLIPADDTQPTQEVQPENGQTFTLAELYRWTNSSIVECFDLPDGRVLVCDEESKCGLDPVPNQRASAYMTFPTAGEMRAQIALANKRGDNVFFYGELPVDDDAPADYLAGDVLLCAQQELA